MADRALVEVVVAEGGMAPFGGAEFLWAAITQRGLDLRPGWRAAPNQSLCHLRQSVEWRTLSQTLQYAERA